MSAPSPVTSTLLLDSRPLVIIPELAVAIGLNEAIFLQQLHYWLKRGDSRGDIGVVYDGRRWIYNTILDWHKQFPFLSERTLQRVIGKLAESKLVITDTLARITAVARQTGHDPRDRITFYTIDYERLACVAADENASSWKDADGAACQIGALQAASEPRCRAPTGPTVYGTETTPESKQHHPRSQSPSPTAAPHAAAPSDQIKGHKRERTHRPTGVVYWYDDEPDDIARDVEDFGLDAVRAVAETFRHAGKVPLRGRVAEALRAERAAKSAEAQRQVDREHAIQERKERVDRDSDPANQAAGAKARADLMRKFGIKVQS